MLIESANQTGAVTGVLTSLAFTLWIAFGQPRPIAPTLPVTSKGCDAQVLLQHVFNVTNTFTEASSITKYVIVLIVWIIRCNGRLIFLFFFFQRRILVFLSV